MINHESDSAFGKGSGLYRLQDTDGDDQFDKITLLKALDGEGEHGPHSIVLSPDKKSLFVIAGNFTKIPEMQGYRNFPDGKIDNLLPLIKDPNGHDNTVNWHGGWIANVDSTGTNWELYSSGFRNPLIWPLTMQVICSLTILTWNGILEHPGIAQHVSAR
jgi:glucose/arabinose dehydrogenase